MDNEEGVHSAQGAPMCTVCESSGGQRCSQCHRVHYCSRECQRTDWPIHKLLCRSFSDFLTRPGPLFRRAILFPVDEKAPKFIWVEVTTKHTKRDDSDSEGDDWELAELDGLLGSGHNYPGRMYFQHNALRNRGLENTIEIVHRDNFLSDGSLPNQSIIAATKGALSWTWKGPFVVFQNTGLTRDVLKYGDITLDEFRHTVDYFITYNNKKFMTADQLDYFNDLDIDSRTEGQGPKQPVGLGKAKGVKISCDGDQEVFKAEKYIPIDLPDDHPIFSKNNKPIGISKLIELPILILKSPAHQAWKDEAQDDNQAVTFLQLDVDPKSDFFGWAPLWWQNRVGTVLAVRADRKPLSPHHMEALCYFCQFEMQPLFEDSMGGGYVQRTRADVMKRMTRASFEEFFQEYKEKGRMARTPSPYA